MYAPGSLVAAVAVSTGDGSSDVRWLQLAHPRGCFLPLTDASSSGRPLFRAVTEFEEAAALDGDVRRWSCNEEVPAAKDELGDRWGEVFVGPKGYEEGLLRVLEATYLAELHAWTLLDQGRGTREPLDEPRDRFEKRTAASKATWPRIQRARRAKDWTNRAVASAARQAAFDAGLAPETARALVLDGVEGMTTTALESEGFLPQNILSPNIVPSVASALRRRGVQAWAGRVEDFLSAPLVPPLQLLYLDHTGAFPPRAPQIQQVFRSRAVGAGGVLACTFSMRSGPWAEGERIAEVLPPGWSHAHAAHALARKLQEGASAAGLEVEGVNIEGLDDYDLASVEQPGGNRRLRSSTRANASGALAEALDGEDLVGLAAALAAWAADGADTEATSGELAWLRQQAAQAAERVLSALGAGPSSILGAAWRVGRRRGRPHAVLGAEGAVADSAVDKLRSVAARVLQVADRRSSAVVPVGGSMRTATTMRRCMLIYPEEMMFFAVRLRKGRDIGSHALDQRDVLL